MKRYRLSRFTLFEHQTLRIGQHAEDDPDLIFTEAHRKALEKFYGKGLPYFTLIHRGVLFNEYVGVLQVGNLIIEILPKADKYGTHDDWRSTLIGMLRAVGAFDIHAPSSSDLNIKTNFILDLYFELFVKEVEYLLHKGLIRKYRKTSGNSTALKGALDFGKHIQHNLVHQELFYIKYTTYDQHHLIHQILYMTLELLQRINVNALLASKIGALLLNFPEMHRLAVTEATFNKIIFTRKNVDYQNAVKIARLLLLNYHPDVTRGKDDVLSLMFDMNALWEKFIYVSLRRHSPAHLLVKEQSSKRFWKPKDGYNSSIIADIVVSHKDDGKAPNFVLDTKWKNISGRNPSPDDLRQLYVYHAYFSAKKVALVYPGESSTVPGKYYKLKKDKLSKKECSVITIPTDKTIVKWQENIANTLIEEWMGIESKSKSNINES